MKSKLIFATHNTHKVEEIKNILGDYVNIIGLTDISDIKDIPETSDSLEGNALQKAEFVYNKLNKNCFADDTGLEVDFLNGQPGVFSARYAGENCDSEKNIDKLLHELNNVENRNARFRTIIALIIDGKRYIFEGEVKGQITKQRAGNNGFGYDSVFIPDGYNKTFAQMDQNEKNSISHRGNAIKKLKQFLIDNTN